MPSLNADYWNERYLHHDTPWDIGSVSPPLQHFFEQLPDKNMRILIPGAGHAHEVGYLFQQGFTEVYVCDWAHQALQEFLNDYPDFPQDHLLEEDFFKLKGQYDLIVEQTFFCALLPKQRPDYARKMHTLLFPDGCLMGLLFAEEFPFEGPPFGGTKAAYLSYFEPFFQVQRMEIAPDSIRPRAGREFFFLLKKEN